MENTLTRLTKEAPLPRRWRGLALAVLVIVSGCAGPEAIYQEVVKSRTLAYVEWQQAKERRREAEPVIKGDLSLQDAVRTGIAYNKSLHAVLKEREIARGRVVEAYSGGLPKLTLMGNYTRLDEVSSFEVAGNPVSLGFEDNYSVDLQLSQPLYRGGSIPAALRAARVYACLSDETVRAATQGTIYSVARGYYDVLLAQRLFAVQEDAVKSAEAHLEDVKRKRTGGAASQFDVLRAQVDVSNFKAEMIQQKNRTHLAKVRLLRSMGVSQESDVTLSGDLTHEPIKPVLEKAVKAAFENRPDLYQADLAVKLQEEALRITRSRYLPSVDATFTQRWANPDPHNSTSDEWDNAWNAGVTFTWPLFDGLAQRGRMIQERAILDRKNIELLDAQEQVLLEVRQAILSLGDAEEFVKSQQQNFERASEALRLAEVGYRQGVNTEIEVIDARSALTRAKGLHYQAVYNHTVARLELQRAMGILGPRASRSQATKEEKPVRPGFIDEFDGPGILEDEGAPASEPRQPEGE